jgi:hypothetical protein
LNPVTHVPVTTRPAPRPASGRDLANDSGFELALGAAAASQPPVRAEAREPEREPDAGAQRQARSHAGVEHRERDDAAAAAAGATRTTESGTSIPSATPRDAVVQAENGAQNAPAPPHPAVTGGVATSPLRDTAFTVPELAPVPELVPVPDAAPATTATATAAAAVPRAAAGPADSLAQPLPGGPELDVRVVVSRPDAGAPDAGARSRRATSDAPGAVIDSHGTLAAQRVPAAPGTPREVRDVRPVAEAPDQGALLATPVALPGAVPAPDAPSPRVPRLALPAAPGLSARDAGRLPEGAGAPALPASPVPGTTTTVAAATAATVAVAADMPQDAGVTAVQKPQAPAPGTPAQEGRTAAEASSAQARIAAAAQRGSQRSGQHDADTPAREERGTPQQGARPSGIEATTEPAPSPALATMPARTAASTLETPRAARTELTASTMAAADARFEPMRRAADQVTLQFQGEGGLEGRLRIAVRGDTVHASILSADEGTLARLGGETGTLRRALSEQGFSQARISVHDLRAGGATSTSETRQQAHEGDDRRQGEPQRRSGQGRESRQGGESAKDRRASRDERRSE